MHLFDGISFCPLPLRAALHESASMLLMLQLLPSIGVACNDDGYWCCNMCRATCHSNQNDMRQCKVSEFVYGTSV